MESADNQEKSRSGMESTENGENSQEQSLSKVETIALLNDSIDRLEQTIKSLSENAAPIPSSDSIKTLLTTTQELANTVTSDITTEETAEIEAAASSEQELAAETTPEVPSHGESDPESTLVDEPVQPKSDQQQKQQEKEKKFPWLWVICATIAIAFLGGYWYFVASPGESFSSLTSLLPPTTTEIVDNVNPLDGANEVNSVTTTQELEQPAQSTDTTALNNLPVEPNSTTADTENLIEIDIPADLAAPGRAKNLKIVTIEPKLNFTPEQTLIAALKTKVAQIPQDYPQELVDSVKVNLADNSLLVEVTDRWYQLDESEQNKIGNEMLESSRQYHFQQLKLQDKSGILVARNPVIGDEIVVLEREQP